MLSFNRAAVRIALVAGLIAISTSLSAQPIVTPFGPPISGHVTNGRTGQPAAGAIVLLYQRGKNLGEGRTDANGNFRITGLPKVETAADGTTGLYMLIARLPENKPTVAPIAVPVPPASGIPVQVELPEAAPLRVKVTDTKGQPLVNAVVSAPKIWLNASNERGGAPIAWEHLGLPIAGYNITEEGGSTTVPALPQGAQVRLLVHKKGFADNVVTLKVPSAEEVTVKLPRETIVGGTVLLGDEPLKGVTKWRMKMQGWRAPWAEGELWRMSYFDANGHYEIRNVPSLEVLGEPTYSGNIDMDGNTRPSEGITGSYVPPQRGWDLMVTLERGGKTERWISYVKAMDTGLKYEEGEKVHSDMRLEPLALVKGTLKVAPGTRPLIVFANPKSIYGDWVVTPNADGSFEIPLPTGDVTITVAGKPLKIDDLKAHEVRAVTVP